MNISVAKDAFDVSAIDFLLKPLSESRFEQALNKADIVIKGPPGKNRDDGRATFIRFFKGMDLMLANLDEVIFFQAQRKYTRVVLDGNEGLLRMGLSEVEGKLDLKNFARIHRGLVINLRHVQTARRDEFGRVVVTMASRQERLIVSRPYEQLFRDGFL